MRNSIFTLAILVIAIASIFPPEEKLRLGKDLRGGTTLVYAVEIPPGADDADIMDKTIQVLKRRVDPSGLLEIQMVAQGRDRIEVTMPLPSERVKELRRQFDQELEKLGDCSVSQSAFERALRLEDPAERAERLETMSCGDPDRGRLLAEAAAAFDEMVRAEALLAEAESGGAPQEEIDHLVAMVVDAQIAYEELADRVVEGQLTPEMVEEALRLPTTQKLLRNEEGKYEKQPSARQRRLNELRQKYPGEADQIDQIVAAFEQYEAERTSLDDPEDLKRLISAAGVPSFRIVVDPQGSGSANTHPEEARLRQELRERGPGNVRSRDSRWCKINDITTFPAGPESVRELAALEADPAGYFAARGFVGEEYGGDYYILCWDTPGVTMNLTREAGDWRIANAFQTVDDVGRPAIGFDMDARGAALMGKLTGQNVGNKMAVLLDEQVYTAPTLQGTLGRSGRITGDFTNEQINYVIQVLTAGSLSANLSPEPISENRIAAEFGADNLRAGQTAGLIALVSVSGFMIFYYFVFGGVAVLALLFNAVLILSAMSLSRAAFTLPGIAGIILTFGMAVDANVLIYERVREELQKGMDLRTSVKLGYEKALSSIVDGNVTNLIVAVVLANLGTQEIRGFAITLGIGVVATMFTGLIVSRLLLAYLVDVAKIKRLRMLPMVVPILGRVLEPRINWMGLRYICIVVSLIGVGIGVGMVWYQGEEMLDTEFRGGTQVQFELREATPEEAAAGAANEAGNLTMTRADVEARIHALGGVTGEDDPLRPLRTAEVSAINPERDGVTSDQFQVKTYATNADAVIGAVVAAFEDVLESQPALTFDGVGRVADSSASLPVYPVLARTLGDVIQRPGFRGDVSEFYGGVVILLEDLRKVSAGESSEIARPTKENIEERLAQMRSKPDFSSTLGRRVEVRVLEGTEEAVKTAAVLVWDDGLSYIQNETAWENDLALREWSLVVSALGRPTTLASVQNFSAVIAKEFRNTAVVAVFLSMVLILIYIWVRFGSMRYSLAAISTLMHDVMFALGLIALAEIMYDSEVTAGIARALLLEPFKIDLNLVAAMLTIIGYSLNDTIIIMDRIRENRGRMPYATKKMVNDAINQTISRTAITSGTTLLAALVLYIFGGSGVRAFSFALLCGVGIGTYSSIAVAAPLVWSRRRDLSAQKSEARESNAPRMP